MVESNAREIMNGMVSLELISDRSIGELTARSMPAARQSDTETAAVFTPALPRGEAGEEMEQENEELSDSPALQAAHAAAEARGDMAAPSKQLSGILEGWSGVSATLNEEGEPQVMTTGAETMPKAASDLAVAPLGEITARAGASAESASMGAEVAANDGETTANTARIGSRQSLGTGGSFPDASASGALAAAQGLGEDHSSAKAVGTERADIGVNSCQQAPAIDVARTSLPRLESRPVSVAARAIMAQVADAIVTAQKDHLEIALSPEELGRVRMIVTGADRAAQVTVWVERPEVMDLLRRNANLLLQHFEEAGLGGAAFVFREDRQGSGAGPDDTARRPRDDMSGMPTASIAHAVSLRTTVSGERRIDIRL